MKHINKTTIVLIAILLSFNLHAQFGGPAVVKVEKVQNVMMAPVRKIPAMVEAKYVAMIKTEYKGTVINLAEVGKTVKKGEILAVLRDTQSRLRKEELEGAVKSAQAQLNFLKSENTRLNGLIGKKLISNSELDENKSKLISARNDKAQASSRLDQYLDQVKRLKVKAPYDGIVLAQLAQPGQLLNNGNEIIEFMQANNLEVKVNVPFKYKAQINIGEIWQVETQNNTKINATIKGFIRAARGSSHTIEVRLSVTSLDLWSGEAVNVLVPTQTQSLAMAVPRDALVIRNNGVYVYKIVDNKSVKVDVETGMAQGEKIQIMGDISDGDTIVIRGNESLRNQQDVKIID